MKWQYRQLSDERIVETADTLRKRITERFPDSGLGEVAAELHQVASQTVERVHKIRQRNWATTIVAWLLILAGIYLLAYLLVNPEDVGLESTESGLKLTEFVGLVDAAFSSLVFLGAGALFLLSLEARSKRKRALEALHELRAMAHIVDMHQLTKDPESMLGHGPPTASSPKRTMTPFQLHRYLDYCSELQALIAKIGALYVQDFPDSVALEAVDQVESLTTGLSRKIWQKMVILDRYVAREVKP